MTFSFKAYLKTGNVPGSEGFSSHVKSFFTQRYRMYFKEKWRSTAENGVH